MTILKLLKNLLKEHLAIRERKKPNDPIDSNDIKSMRFTRAVIFETSILATVVNGVLRKTDQDMELNGRFYYAPLAYVIFMGSRRFYFIFLYFKGDSFLLLATYSTSIKSHVKL